jgi:hypothetical protein
MQASRRWRDWSPAESLKEAPVHEPPKLPKPQLEHLLSVLSVRTLGVSEEQAAISEVAPFDLAQWRRPFAHWLAADCAEHPRAFGGANRLHRAFNELAIRQGVLSCTIGTFLRLLEERGYLSGEIHGELLVSGITFRDDVAASGLRPASEKQSIPSGNEAL